jgi:hypothetical protein
MVYLASASKVHHQLGTTLEAAVRVCVCGGGGGGEEEQAGKATLCDGVQVS